MSDPSSSSNGTQGGKIFTSDEPDIDLREIEKEISLGHRLLKKLADEQADKLIFVDVASGRKWKGSDVREKVLNISTALLDLYDFKRGTSVCISYDHSDYSCLLALAVICAGGIVACAFPKDPYAELLYLAKKVGAKFLFCHEKNMSWGKKLETDMNHEVVTIAMGVGSDKLNPTEHFEYLLNYEHKKSKSLDRIPVPCEDMTNEVALITMSSGTTGKPKAVPATHWNCLTDLGSRFSRATKMELRFACIASLDYVSGRLIVFGAIESGFTAYLINGFENEKLCQAIQEYKLNILYLGAASFYSFITYEKLDKYDLSSLRMIFPMGAKIIYLDELKRFFERCPNIKYVRQGYGASELSGGAMNALSPEEYLKDCANCGRLLPSVKAKIVDPETGALLGPNKEGILHISGPRNFPGYYDMSNGTKDSPFVRDESAFDKDGFYITGDIAYFNEKEELFIVGRQKELMSCRGAKKVLPQELEETIAEHPAVDKVCVLGMPNKKELTLHCPRAFITLKQNYYTDALIEMSGPGPYKKDDDEDDEEDEEKLSRKGEHKLCSLASIRRHHIEDDIMNFVNERVGWEKQLTGGIVILDEIGTRGATGKIDKGYLRNLSFDQVEIYGDRSE